MGGVPSSVQLGWNQEEELEIKKAKIIQKKAADFVIKHLFDGVPTKANKHSVDPLSPVFIMPDDNNPINRSKVGIDNKFFSLIPTTVMISHDGLIRVVFFDTEITYDLALEMLERANKELSASITIPGPQPPKLQQAYRHSLDIYWSLPYPAGVCQAVDIQYAKVFSSSTSKRSDRLLFKSSRSAVADGYQWLNWTQKRWHDKRFLFDCLNGLDSGTGYVFRMRYKSFLGWSEFSSPSEVHFTRPDVPSRPKVITCLANTPYSALLSWEPPSSDNGAAVTGYLLQGRSVGDSFVDLYRGAKTSHIVFSLFPGFAYSFMVAAENSEGLSEFSTMFSIQTPPRLQYRSGLCGYPSGGGSRNQASCLVPEHGSSSDTGVSASGSPTDTLPVMGGYEEAMQCRQAWKECWDDRSQSFFYFNMMTGVRQREPPAVWGQHVALIHRSAAESLGVCITSEDAEGETEDETGRALLVELHEEEEARSKKNELRRKKYQFYKSLIKLTSRRSADTTNDLQTSDSHNVDDLNHISDVRYPAGRQKLFIKRKELLFESFKYLMASSPSLLRAGRLQVDFEDEEGIDSGGLSKEFFLLLSKGIKSYGMASSRRFLLDVGGRIFFKNRMQRSNDSSRMNHPLSNDKNDSGDEYQDLPRVNIGATILTSMDGDEGSSVQRAEYAFFLGRVVGKALLDRQFVDLPLCDILWKQLLTIPLVGHNVPLTEAQQEIFTMRMSDLKLLDNELYNSFIWMLNNPIEGIFDEAFTVQLDSDGTIVPLCKDGEKITLTDSNKCEYVDLMVKWRTEFCVKTELDHFVKGFCDIIPRKCLIESGLTIQELHLLLNGKARVDVEEIRAYTIYQSSGNNGSHSGGAPFGEHTDHVAWLWMLLRKMNDIEQGRFLHFVTGTSCVPLDGFDPPFNITDGEDMVADSLPKAHTCFNQIVLPKYSSYEVLREKVLFAVFNTEGFALT